jgi:hypothetical protein
MSRYGAPWSAWVTVPTAFVSGLGILLPVTDWRSSTADPYLLTFLPLGISVFAAFFTIRGYTVTPDAIRIQRLLWSTELPLSDLVSARFEPRVMRWGIRTFGNGGVFSISGWFYGRRLGAYRAFVMDPRRTVVLEFSSRTVVISPDNPEAFVDEITERIGASTAK